MVNPDDFIKRLETILEYYSLNASSFADKIGAQRSSMSHLLSGRNKPSLDFVLKILEEFPEIDLYWLLNGNGSFPKTENKSEVNSSTSSPLKKDSNDESLKVKQLDAFSELEEETKKNVAYTNESTESVKIIKKNSTTDSDVERIVIFYTNGTFTTYTPA